MSEVCGKPRAKNSVHFHPLVDMTYLSLREVSKKGTKKKFCFFFNVAACLEEHELSGV